MRGNYYSVVRNHWILPSRHPESSYFTVSATEVSENRRSGTQTHRNPPFRHQEPWNSIDSAPGITGLHCFGARSHWDPPFRHAKLSNSAVLAPAAVGTQRFGTGNHRNPPFGHPGSLKSTVSARKPCDYRCRNGEFQSLWVPKRWDSMGLRAETVDFNDPGCPNGGFRDRKSVV